MGASVVDQCFGGFLRLVLRARPHDHDEQGFMGAQSAGLLFLQRIVLSCWAALGMLAAV